MESIFGSYLEVDDDVLTVRGCSSGECDSFVSDDFLAGVTGWRKKFLRV